MWMELMNTAALAAGGAMTLSGLGYVAASYVVAERFTTARSHATGFTPKDADLAYEDVRFHARYSELRLAAWHVAAAAPRGAVILVHGKGASKGNELNTQAMILVRGLLDEGLSVLMLDLRGHGESDAARMTYGLNERLDVLGAVDWLMEQGYAAGTIGVLGASMGASAAIAAAAEEPAIGAVASDSAFADFAQVLSYNFPRVMRTRFALALLPGALWMVERMTGAALHRFRPGELIERLNDVPLLLIHARGDRFITVEHVHRLAHASGTGAWVSDSDNHVGTFSSQPEAYVARVREFFRDGL